MRPLELDLTAFRSYDRATLDLRPHELVVITGDTGAGKSSLLDAICFALFGRTPEQSTPTDLLGLGRDHGEVRLTFSARGEVWRVTRRYGPRAPEPRHVLERLADDGGAAVETITGSEALGERLAAVVGVGYRAFTSAVLLAQGRFSEFLTAQPKARDDILRELFAVASLEGARAAAQAAEAAALAEVRMREGDVARLPAHGPGERTAAARAAREAASRHAAAVRLRPLAAQVAVHREREERARGRLEAARAAAADLPDGDASAALANALAAARGRVGEARGARERCRAARERADAVREATRARHGAGAAELAALHERAQRIVALLAELPGRERALVEDTRAQATARRDLDQLASRLAAAVADDEAARARATLLRAARAHRAEVARLAAAERALQAAEGTARRARLHDLAATIRAGLGPGEPCPVCGGAVAEHAPEGDELGDAEVAVATHRREVTEATGAHAASGERLRVARDAATAIGVAGVDEGEDAPDDAAESQRRESAIVALRAEVRATEEALRAEGTRRDAAERDIARDRAELDASRAGLGRWADHPSPVAALQEAIAEAAVVEAAAQAAADDAARAADAAMEAERALAALETGPLAALRAASARAAGRGGLEAPSDDATPEDLIAGAERLRRAALAAADAHAAAAEAAAAEAARAAAALAAEGAALAIDGPELVEPAVRRLRDERDRARRWRDEFERTAASARALAADAAAARARAQLRRQVALDLRANAFPRYLLARYRERLAIAASTHLQELSGGDFRFSGAEPDPMAVVDGRRGERLRPAATLSGGERFLASLALALGLGDVAGETGGRVECLFLDEGFSTLDGESLEQALAGVERLAGDGRLVGVITHLPGVAERLGATIHVTKDPDGVSSIRGR